MEWKKDKLRPTQPYFVLDAEDFHQEIYLRQGISHFYTYRSGDNDLVKIVPDGCMDIVFEYHDGTMEAYVRGTSVSYVEEVGSKNREFFGVRFMPGILPEIINIRMREAFNKQVELERVVKGDGDWIGQIAKETDFYQRIRVFLEAYTKAEKKKEKPFGKRELVNSVKSMVYESDGKIKIAELQERTGYSARYINRVFIEEMGFSPKVFCKIIQFQRALEFLNYGAPDKMTDAAVELGYYDQSQFIRDFSKYAGITPKKYLNLVREKGYIQKALVPYESAETS